MCTCGATATVLCTLNLHVMYDMNVVHVRTYVMFVENKNKESLFILLTGFSTCTITCTHISCMYNHISCILIKISLTFIIHDS